LILSIAEDPDLRRRPPMSEQRADMDTDDVDDEPITAGPWSRRSAGVVRLRWTERPPHDAPLQAREEVFSTMPEAEEFKRELEAKGFEVSIV
jgi:hypothetical protein